MAFTDELWQDGQPVYKAILAHPFIVELAAGTLSRERFVFYMKQDALYLQDFSRSLAIAGARQPVVANMQAFLDLAAGVAAVERALHETYLVEFEARLDVERAPACFAYTHFLLATASLGGHAEAIAALLPCFWVYREVGLQVYGQADLKSNPYARWIETYSGEPFGAAVERAISICEDVAQSASAAEQDRMRLAFDRSVRLEWSFWDSAYRLETWPPN
ncbi:MAG TPA: thiaminase II [Dehalococcoidia bacterium]|nr:thiaminase II [Dehalococcoidia bacterium]